MNSSNYLYIYQKIEKFGKNYGISSKKLYSFLILGLFVKEGIIENENRGTIWNIIKISLKNSQISQKLVNNGLLMLIAAMGIKTLLKKIKQQGMNLKYKACLQKAQQFQEKCRLNILKLDIPEYGQELVSKVVKQDVVGLKSMLEKKEVTSVQLLQIFMKRVQKIGLEHNLVTVDNYQRSLKLAEWCDQERQKLSKEELDKKMLFGIPVSIKDCFIIKDLNCCVGSISHIDKVYESDGLSIQIILENGGIPFVKSNVPQLQLTMDTNNFIFGKSLNPWNKERSAGGSTGGEAGLIATGCSPIGMGTDIGSSIRQPCSFCGLYGLKPSCGRIVNKGMYRSDIKEMQLPSALINTSVGPMAKSVQDLSLFMQAMLNQDIWKNIDSQEQRDHYYSSQAFDLKEYNKKHKKLKIGYFKSLDYFPSAPSSQRAVDIVIEKLNKLGHKCVPVQIPDVTNIIYNFYLSFGPEGFSQLNRWEKMEPIINDYSTFLNNQKRRKEMNQQMLKGVHGELYEELKNYLNLNESAGKGWGFHPNISSLHYKALNEQICKQKQSYQKWFQEQKLDAIISPTVGLPALRHDQAKDLVDCISYSGIFNILDLPSGTVPVTLVQENEQKMQRSRDNQVLQHVNECLRGSVGLPVGVSVSCLHKQEEKVLNIMKIIEKEIDFYQNHELPFSKY